MIDPIPYIHPGSIGPFQPFGLLVATGILVGSWFAARRAAQGKLDLDEVRGAVAWAVVVGFIGAHLVAVVYYKPERVDEEGLIVLLKVWDGISSYGGFAGALLGLLIYYGYRRYSVGRQIPMLLAPLLASALTAVDHRLGQITLAVSMLALAWYYRRPVKPWMGVAEVIVQALVVGWIFGRAGCFVAFDHPGHLTDFALGQVYRGSEEVRHNLGLYEMLYTALVMLPVMLLLFRRNPPMGTILGWMCVLYAPVRFALDFLRATDIEVADARFLGLTPAQYFSIAVLGFAIYWLLRVRRLALEREDYPRVQDMRLAMSAPAPTRSGKKRASKRSG